MDSTGQIEVKLLHPVQDLGCISLIVVVVASNLYKADNACTNNNVAVCLDTIIYRQ